MAGDGIFNQLMELTLALLASKIQLIKSVVISVEEAFFCQPLSEVKDPLFKKILLEC